MRRLNYKYTLYCGTLSLSLLGGIPQVNAGVAEVNLAIMQQNRQVSGNVKDAMGAIIGASIVEKGTTNGTITDMDGNFVLNVQPGATLVVSYVGYKTKEVKVGTSPLDITLEEDSKVLSEVVVTALGLWCR